MKMLTKNFAIATIAATALGLSALSSAVLADDHGMGDKAEDAAETAGQATSDTWITSKVRASFVAESELSALDIGVETNEGVVTLTGEVNTDAQRELAIKVVEDIEGVKEVAADGLQSHE
ncbi:BON domain-containing protein [Halopseudomonas salegens]|uniref:Osmotically-inducible protein Y n=1 Tax=Halopseudomonas salegens TaxID=1434072 RepID=A0A1H2F4E9_9GAMM|nr:BON domain-containing protein [Halopseudomonas salegens]SDU02143.1 hyperosmotically inducible protein [Halopseudomonas salegens]